MPPSPHDGSDDDPPPPGVSIQPVMTATFGNALPTPNPCIQEGSVARDGAPQPTNPDFLATILCIINAVCCNVSERFDNLGDVNAHFDALNDRLQMMESFGTRLNNLDEHFAKPDEVLDELENHVKKTDALLGTNIPAYNEQVRKTDDLLEDLDKQIKTDELLSAKIIDYGSHFRHITNTLVPRLQTNLATLATRVTTLENHPSEPAPVPPPPITQPTTSPLAMSCSMALRTLQAQPTSSMLIQPTTV
jgi:hypothetical protein